MDQEGGGPPLHPESSHILSPSSLPADLLKQKGITLNADGLVLTAAVDDAAVSSVLNDPQSNVLFVFCLWHSSDLINRFVMMKVAQ